MMKTTKSAMAAQPTQESDEKRPLPDDVSFSAKSMSVSVAIGALDGLAVGFLLGDADGSRVGTADGAAVDGDGDGLGVGRTDGAGDGDGDGTSVGLRVGFAVVGGSQWQSGVS